MYVRRHVFRNRVVYAICDKELIGQILRDSSTGTIIDLDKYKYFYIGDDDFYPPFESINAVGEKSVEFLIDRGIVKRKFVKYVNKIPHIQVYNI